MTMWANPWVLLFLLPLGVAAWRVLRASKPQGILFASATTAFARSRPTWRQRACRLLPYLILLGVACLIIGAANPRTQLSREVRSADALAVMMALDVSGSMRALDLSEGRNDVTRLDVVKRVFKTFAARRPDDLIGVVAFGGYASVRSPLTADHRALMHTLGGIQIPGDSADDLVVAQDELLTAIGDGLALSLLRLKDAEPKTKIVILLSDGESNAGAVTPTEATQAAKELGVRVYTIGVGTTGTAPFKARNAFGEPVIVQAQTSLDETTLKAIARETGGDYANVRSPEQLDAFLKHVSELETTRVERRVYARYRSHARPWLLGGGALLFLSSGLLFALLRRPA